MNDCTLGRQRGRAANGETGAFPSGRDPEFFGWRIVPYTSTQGGTGIALMKTLP